MHTLLAIVTDSTSTTSLGGGAYVGGLLGYLIAAFAYYGIFTKAGEAGWQGFIPIWNAIVLLKIAGKPAWWILLFLIPIVNVVFIVLALHALSLSFGHGGGFTVGLVFLSIIFLYILGYSANTYRGPVGMRTAGTGYAAG